MYIKGKSRDPGGARHFKDDIRFDPLVYGLSRWLADDDPTVKFAKAEMLPRKP